MWSRLLAVAFCCLLVLIWAPIVRAQGNGAVSYTDPTSGVAFSLPSTISGRATPTKSGINWLSDDKRISINTLQFPQERPLQEIYQRLKSRDGRQLAKDELSATSLHIEGMDRDGSRFIVRVTDGPAGKRGISIVYASTGKDLAPLARQIASTFKPSGTVPSNAALPRPIPSTVPPAAPKPPSAAANAPALQASAAKAGPSPAIAQLPRTTGGQAPARPAAPSVPLPACAEAKAALQAMAASLRVQSPRPQFAAGEGSDLSWSFRPQQKRVPVYLFISFDRPVRFNGEGFYVLQPLARAPFALTHAAKATRMVVPLYVQGGQTSRTIQFTPVLAGDVTVSAHLVAPSNCGEQLSEVLAPMRASVSPGKPQIEIADDNLIAEALEVILSPSGERAIEVTRDKTFRLVSWPQRQPIRSFPGSQPRFSPTGRYLSTNEGEIIDALDGASLQSAAGTFSWDNRDSFIVASASGHGRFELHQPGGGASSGTSLGCRPCEGLDSGGIRIDLENNLLLAATNFSAETAAQSLTERLSYSDGMWDDKTSQKTYGSSTRFAQLVSQVAPLSFPKKWEFIEKPQFPYGKTARTSSAEELNRLIAGHGLVPVLKQPKEAIAKAASASGTRSARLARSVTAVDPGFDPKRRSMQDRMREFGIIDHPVIRFEHVADALPPPTRARQLGGPPDHRPYKHDKRILVDPGNPDDDCGVHPAPNPAGELRFGLSRAEFWSVQVGASRLSLIGGGCRGGSMGVSYPIIGLIDNRRPGRIRPLASAIPYFEARNPGGACSIETCGHRSALSHDRYLLMWSPAGIEFFDLQGETTLAFAPFRQQAIDTVSLSPDARHIIQRNTDGTFAIHDVRRGVPLESPSIDPQPVGYKGTPPTAVLFGRYADDEIVVWTPSGYFDATYEGAAQVNLRFAGITELYTFDQFASLMRKPGLLALVLKGDYKDAPIAYRNPPTIAGDIRGDGARIRLSVRQTSGQPLSRLLVYQDGLATAEQALAPGATELEAARLPGVRYVAVVGVDGSGLVSQPLHVDIGPAPTRRTLKVLGVAADVYSDPRLPKLAFAKSDVHRLVAAAATGNSQLYGRVEATKLFDGEATRDSVLSTLRRILADSSVETDVMLMFAGHGVKGSDGGYYLALTGSNTSDLARTGIGWKEVADLVNRSRSRVTIVLDSCHSGEAGKGLFVTNDEVTTGLLANSGGNVIVFAGSKGREYSLEQKELSGGVFSAALSTALLNAGGATDTNGNGILEATEVYAVVRQFVGKHTKGQQTPWIARNKMIGDVAWY